MDSYQTKIDVKNALEEIQRLNQQIRTSSLWTGWLWLIIGTATAIFGVFAPPISSGLAKYAVTLGFILLGIFTFIFAYCQKVIGRVAARIEYPITWTFAAFVIIDSLFRIIVRPTHLSLSVITIGILPALPCLYGAWRVWRHE